MKLMWLIVMATVANAYAAADDDARRRPQSNANPPAVRNEMPSRGTGARGIAKATDYIGKTVGNTRGEKLGEVIDLAIDGPQGRVAYVVVASGGVFGIGQHLYAVPIDALRKSPGADHDLMLDIPKQRLAARAGFDADRWPAQADRQLIAGPESGVPAGAPREKRSTSTRHVDER